MQEVLIKMAEVSGAEELIYTMKKISLDLTAQLELNLKTEDISGVQVYFMVYILRHHRDSSYLTDMCHEIGVSKSTLSALIKKLREKGYLYFQEDPDDIRKKKVLPTEKLFSEGGLFLQKAEQMEAEICSVLDPQEIRLLCSLERKLLSQFTKMELEHNEVKNDRRLYYREKSFTATQTV